MLIAMSKPGPRDPRGDKILSYQRDRRNSHGHSPHGSEIDPVPQGVGQPRLPAADPPAAGPVGGARTDRGAGGTGPPQAVEEDAGLTARPGRGMAAAAARERRQRGAPGAEHGATPGAPPRPRRPAWVLALARAEPLTRPQRTGPARQRAGPATTHERPSAQKAL